MCKKIATFALGLLSSDTRTSHAPCIALLQLLLFKTIACDAGSNRWSMMRTTRKGMSKLFRHVCNHCLNLKMWAAWSQKLSLPDKQVLATSLLKLQLLRYDWREYGHFSMTKTVTDILEILLSGSCAASSFRCSFKGVSLCVLVWDFVSVLVWDFVSVRGELRIWRVFSNASAQFLGVDLLPISMVLLQPLRWRCVECVIHHERDVREEQHPYISGTNKQ